MNMPTRVAELRFMRTTQGPMLLKNSLLRCCCRHLSYQSLAIAWAEAVQGLSWLRRFPNVLNRGARYGVVFRSEWKRPVKRRDAVSMPGRRCKLPFRPASSSGRIQNILATCKKDSKIAGSWSRKTQSHATRCYFRRRSPA